MSDLDLVDLETAVSILKQDIKDNPEKLELERNTLEKYGKLFAYDNIDNITVEQFEDFCDFKNNHHWTISRHKTNLTQDMPKLKKSLKILLDETIPIANRLKRLRDTKNPDYQKYLGEAYFSPILLVTHPEKYPVYNETVKIALDEMHLTKTTSRDIWERYPEIQNIISGFAQQHNLSLWQMDWVWWKALGAKSFEKLLTYIQDAMVMQENYQPIVLRKILESKSATREEIDKELYKYNPGSESKSMTDTVLAVLQRERNQMIRKEEHRFVINSINELSDPQSEELVDACNKRLEEFDGSEKSKHWIWSVTPENWEIVKEKKIWASRIGQKIRDRVRPGDKVIFYVQGTNEFQGIFEFVGEWYDAPSPVWSDETDSVIYQSQIKLETIALGSVRVYDIAPELKMFQNPDDKRLINLVLKGAGGYPSNNGKPIISQDYEQLLELMNGFATSVFLSEKDFENMVNAIPLVAEYNKNKLQSEQRIPKAEDIQLCARMQYYCALRIAELLKLTPSKINLDNNEITMDETIDEQVIDIATIHPSVKDDLEKYLKDKTHDEILFPFTRQLLWSYYKKAGEFAELNLFKKQTGREIEGMSTTILRESRAKHMEEKMAGEALIRLKLRLPISHAIFKHNLPSLRNLKDWENKEYENTLNSISDEPNYWKVSPGEAGEDWENQKSKGFIGIHFFDFDLTGLSEDELRQKILEEYGSEEVAKRANTFGQVRNFMNIKEGDVIVANSGKSKILGIGRVRGQYKFRNDKKYPHTFPVEWYDTTEGIIPKQEGWMVTVIPLEKEVFDELTKLRTKYFLLRHKTGSVNHWRDDIGKQYHFGKIPNYKKIIPGTKTIWFTRENGNFYFWGYGEISRIEKESDEHFHGHYDQFHFFNEPEKTNPGTDDVIPKKESDSIGDKIMELPGWNPQMSMIQIDKEIYDEIIGKDEKTPPGISERQNTFKDEKLSLLTPAEIKTGYTKISDELLIPEEKITEIVTALASGRHVLLAGPIGTGKTRLAKMIPEIFWDKVGGYYSEDHTATADWSTQDVIGGIYPKMEGDKPVYDIQHGCVVDTVRKNWENDVDGGMRVTLKEPQKNPPYKGTWLIIDEFNRADIDKAFGQLFTALRTRWLKIPTDQKGVSYKNLKIPEDYRIIGTLNTADKHFLFQLSDALKSRFAYIEIDIPKKEQWEKEIYYAMKNALDELGFDGFHKIVLDDTKKRIDKEKSEADFYNRVIQAYHFLDTVRVFKKLGTAILKLIFQNLIVGTIMTENSKTSLDNALTSNLIPQLENLSVTFVAAIHAMHSDNLVSYLKDAYKSPNRQSYVEAFEKILNYLEVTNKASLLSDFANGNLKIENEEVWKPIQTAYDNKKNYFEFELDQIKQSMDDLITSMVI